MSGGPTTADPTRLMIQECGQLHQFFLDMLIVFTAKHKFLAKQLLYISKGAFSYDVSSRGGGGLKMLTVADKGGGGRSLADVRST